MEFLSFDSKAKMGSMDLESKSPFIFENNMVFPHNAISIDQGSGETCFPEIIGNSLLSPLMCATHNEFLEEHESSSELSSSIVESKGLFDLIVPSKQKRITGFNSSSPFCKVHGCNKSLLSCKDYHRRHRVCELHSKTAKVIVNGIEQRFCQQCSRFHLLSEFDEGKRSCRKRLADHNERRRKPHSRHHGRLLPPYNPKGSKFKGSTRTMAKASSSTCNNLRPVSSVIDAKHYPSLYDNNNPSSSVLYPAGDQDHFITMDSTCALALLSSQSHGSSSSSHPFNQNNTHRASGMSNNMSPLVMVDSEYMNSENRLWCDENDMSTADLLHLSSQLERVELHKEIVRSNSQNDLE